MLKAAIKEIRAVEAEAEKIKGDAVIEAKRRVDVSRRASKEALEELADLLDGVYAERIKEAEAECEKRMADASARAESQIESMSLHAHENMNNAVEIIVGGILEEWQ